VISCLLVGGVALSGGSPDALKVRITGLLCVSVNAVFRFLVRVMIEVVMARVITIANAE